MAQIRIDPTLSSRIKIPTLGEVLRYTFEPSTIQGVKVSDISGSRNEGTIYGAVDAAGYIGRCLSFDGIDNYVDAGAGSSLNFTSSNFTAVFWFKATAPLSTGYLYSKGLFATDGWHCRLLDSGHIDIYTNQLGANQRSYSKGGGFTSGIWYNAVITRTGATIQVFRNGLALSMDFQAVHVNPASSTRTAKIGIADDTITGPFKGLIDEPRIYNRALSAAEILAHSKMTSHGFLKVV